jgi:hypothetical protein
MSADQGSPLTYASGLAKLTEKYRIVLRGQDSLIEVEQVSERVY